MIDFYFGLIERDRIVFDVETYPNTFTWRGVSVYTGRRFNFEISDRRNDMDVFILFMTMCSRENYNTEWVGFNNIGFDYPVCHFIYINRFASIIVDDIYIKAMSIIKAQDNERFGNMVWESDHIIDQIDLFKIHHFDNKSKSTSLKVLEFNMRMDNIEDLPFDVGIDLNDEQKDILIIYNDHDVEATRLFYLESLKVIELREKLEKQYGRRFMNHNRTKIGADILEHALEDVEPGSCYKYINNKRTKMQTPRDKIIIRDVILPYVQFSNPEFNRILNWFKQQEPTETKGVFTGVSCFVNGFEFVFGSGGIHGSIQSTIVQSTDDEIIIDLDVASYYPNLSVVNGIRPAHLGETWCKVKKKIFDERNIYKKKDKGGALDQAFKEALNGSYGNTNNKYSVFYDPQYTMAITINGQMLLCMLAEALMASPSVRLIQANTDGITFTCPRNLEPWVGQVCDWWQSLTKLTLEKQTYSRMWIRDVNNYIAEFTDGKLKRKGAYEYDIEWHQDHSALVVQKAAEAALVQGKDPVQFIKSHSDIYDFFLRAKVPRSSQLLLGTQRVPNIVRYAITQTGDFLTKLSPPKGPAGEYKRKNGISDYEYQTIREEVGLNWDARIHTKNKSIYEERRTSINTGQCVTLYNNLRNTNHDDIFNALNYDWYINETRKLINLQQRDYENVEVQQEIED